MLSAAQPTKRGKPGGDGDTGPEKLKTATHSLPTRTFQQACKTKAQCNNVTAAAANLVHQINNDLAWKRARSAAMLEPLTAPLKALEAAIGEFARVFLSHGPTAFVDAFEQGECDSENRQVQMRGGFARTLR